MPLCSWCPALMPACLLLLPLQETEKVGGAAIQKVYSSIGLAQPCAVLAFLHSAVLHWLTVAAALASSAIPSPAVIRILPGC